MRVLIFHGYLLGGTGSNVYNSKLAEALVGLGHEVHLLCQDRAPERLEFVDAWGDWDAGELSVQTRREPVRCTVYRPNIGGLLPVYVADRYQGIEARPFADCSDEEIERYVAANVTAVTEVVSRAQPEVALANHLIMGPLVLARALGDGVPYAAKVHGSALEYTVKPHRERFLGAAREGLAGARTVLVGSRHTGESLWAALDEPELPPRTRLGPPGVDIEQFGPRDPAQAADQLAALTRSLAVPPDAGGAGAGAPEGDAFARDEAEAGRALARLDLDRDRLIAFVGKLIVSKGVDLLAAAWPLVRSEVPDARLVVVGFGAYREGLERLLGALARGDRPELSSVIDQGRALEGGPAAPLGLLRDFFDGPHADARYWEAARGLGDSVVLTGRMEHSELAHLLPACEAQVVPSTFPEAFGMVAVEAAACGAMPISAEHSGLAEVSRALAGAVPDAAPFLSFGIGPGAVVELAQRITAWLSCPEPQRSEIRAGLVGTVRERYSWQGVARGVIAAGLGDTAELAAPVA
ncbi:MAG TPA: glycosyltransferase family 4 protein [Solirubrobacteraceae bacterium]|nr:glycosyltransferase family 4 protein [Solirubrobacteraceae bacterium]